jgi:hypothetical protein
VNLKKKWMDIVLGRIKKSNFFFDSSAILFSKSFRILHLLRA